ncbi:MAG: hypothetical protein RO257_03855 [Candidatus Kapabacteria bacterium]|nr:hypothetical protein [Candidatus Kapabacteria bacterium]
MNKRIRIGDIFSVKISENKKKFFQLIAYDLLQLNSDVIRAFKKEYPIDVIPEFSVLIIEEVEFYAHCIIKFGIKLNCWEKIGNILEVGKTENIIFRATNDYGHKQGEEPIRVSKSWYVWRINDNDFTEIGKLEGENRKAEIGIVFDTYSIVHRMKTGQYGGFYPDFE